MKQNPENIDAELLVWYMHGWHDELDGKTRYVGGSPIDKAYQLGRDHAYVGDEISSTELLTNEQILREIKE